MKSAFLVLLVTLLTASQPAFAKDSKPKLICYPSVSDRSEEYPLLHGVDVTETRSTGNPEKPQRRIEVDISENMEVVRKTLTSTFSGKIEVMIQRWSNSKDGNYKFFVSAFYQDTSLLGQEVTYAHAHGKFPVRANEEFELFLYPTNGDLKMIEVECMVKDQE